MNMLYLYLRIAIMTVSLYVADAFGLWLRIPSLGEQPQHLLLLHASFASPGPSAAANAGGIQLILQHFSEQRQSPLSLLAFLARADPSVAV